MPTTKITEAVRAEKLRRANGDLVPSVTCDSEVRGFRLVVTTKGAFWDVPAAPRGRNPATGRRWSPGMRLKLGDAFLTPTGEAKAAAMAAKAAIRQGHSPYHDQQASRVTAVAQRSILPTTAADALIAYEKALMARRQPSEATRRQVVRYAQKAVRLMKAESMPLTAIDASAVRLLVETCPGADGERHHVFGGLNRFLSWSRRQRLLDNNPCNDIDRDERPRPGRARDNVPSPEVLHAVWTAAHAEPQRDLVRFLLLVPLRRDEAAGLRWSEVELDARRILIGAERMKNGQAHELPLAGPALAILKAREPDSPTPGALVFASSTGASYDGWNRLTTRIRKKIGQAETAKSKAFTFHDVRRSFVSLLADRFDVDVLDQCLGHARKGVFGVYQRSARMPERVRAMNVWADLITAQKKVDDDVVVQLNAAAAHDQLAAGQTTIRTRQSSSSVRLPPLSAWKAGEESKISVEPARPVGLLGMTDKERAELKRTKKLPTRQVEAVKGPPGLSLSSPPSREYLWGFSDALRRPGRGRRSTRENEMQLTLECLRERGEGTSEACELYVERSPAVQKETARRQFWRAWKIVQALWNSN
jgi:integrase